MDIALPEDKVHELADIIMTHVTSTIKELRRLFLVEDIVDSLKVRPPHVYIVFVTSGCVELGRDSRGKYKSPLYC